MKLDSFIKPISLKEYHKQNVKQREKHETERKNIPKNFITEIISCGEFVRGL